MKVNWTVSVFLLPLSLLLPLTNAADESKKSTETELAVELREVKTQPVQDPEKIRVPVYNPPKRGAPKGRVGGGTRGGPG